MWYIKFNWTMFVFFVLVTVVKGSCLEYGHSCWGAHGKRSGGKVQNAGTNLPSNEMDYYNEGNAKQTLFDNLDDLVNIVEDANTVTHVTPLDEEQRLEAPEANELNKLKNFLRKRRLRYKQEQEIKPYKNNNNKNNKNKVDDSTGSWRKLPLYNSLQQYAARNDDGASFYYELK